MKYIAKQKDGEILAESYDLSELIQELTQSKIEEIERYFTTATEKIDYDYYFYLAGLLKIYRQADKQIFNNRDYLINVLPNIYNNPKYIDETEYIEIKKHA
ncbi:hypothetical protein [Staphylococcus haemolyticus]|jgi:hypothetical protein|uniref:hypothetical protein n=1 Tax=Staphylococcus haemolyticus TaxID=1283 RepID=UPI00164252C1|nr:hypothetical protein [Staphylococcus haemolyticus]MBC3103870.1 hypothetical protein [Staphylococcus haemolyticus]MBC3144725.1 hypothetical protein [Staphylococcus haemolyticus]